MSPQSNPRAPTLAQRAMELRRLNMPESRIVVRGGKSLRFHCGISPGRYGRLYECVLDIVPGDRAPRMFVMKPDLLELAGGKRPPHLYQHDGRGSLLCLWWPKNNEWDPRQRLANTYLPWTADWLWYFEEWLQHGEWLAGGAHPVRVPKRWSPDRSREIATLVD